MFTILGTARAETLGEAMDLTMAEFAAELAKEPTLQVKVIDKDTIQVQERNDQVKERTEKTENPVDTDEYLKDENSERMITLGFEYSFNYFDQGFYKPLFQSGDAYTTKGWGGHWRFAVRPPLMKIKRLLVGYNLGSKLDADDDYVPSGGRYLGRETRTDGPADHTIFAEWDTVIIRKGKLQTALSLGGYREWGVTVENSAAGVQYYRTPNNGVLARWRIMSPSSGPAPAELFVTAKVGKDSRSLVIGAAFSVGPSMPLKKEPRK